MSSHLPMHLSIAHVPTQVRWSLFGTNTVLLAPPTANWTVLSAGESSGCANLTCIERSHTDSKGVMASILMACGLYTYDLYSYGLHRYIISKSALVIRAY